MSAPAPTAFEDELTAALHQRADAISPPDDARAAIDRRLGRRARARRLRRVGLAAVVAVVLIAGAVAVAQRGHDDASVVTGPGVPAVHLPQLGLPPGIGVTRIMSYVPGRSVSSLLLRGGSAEAPDPSSSTTTTDGGGTVFTPNVLPILGAQLHVVVTDAGLDEFATSLGPNAHPEGSMEIDGRPAQQFTVDGGPNNVEEVVIWQVAQQVVASLSVAVTDVDPPLGPNLVLLAAGLVELDDATWWSLLNPDPDVTWLGTGDPDAVGEISAYTPHESGGSALQILDLPGFPAATFQLGQDNGSGVSLDAVDDPDHVDVRGTSGLITAAPGYFMTAYGFTKSLEWVEGGATYRLDFTDAATPADAVKLAEQLSILSPDEWHDLLFPSTLRTDLVPMPVMRPVLGPPSDAPAGSTVLSVPATSATPPPTTGG